MKNEFNVNFGERVKYFRNIARLSQAQLAEKLDLSPKTISSIETGKNNINFAKLSKLCNILNIKPYQLFIFEKYIQENDNISKTLESMTYNQLEIVHKLLLNLAALRPNDVPKPIR